MICYMAYTDDDEPRTHIFGRNEPSTLCGRQYDKTITDPTDTVITMKGVEQGRGI